MLRLEGITRRFGGLTAVDHVDLEIMSGNVHSIVGPNGAGKTTLFNLISGFIKPHEGQIFLDGREISRLPIHKRVPLGLVRTFQNIRLFEGLTVYENVLVAQHCRAPRLTMRISARADEERRLRARADQLVDLLDLGDYRDRLATGMPYGVQKRLELARAMASQPRVLLLDEPTAGMNESESRRILAEILALRTGGTTIVLVEHDMEVVMGASDMITVLNFGKVIAHGTPQQVFADQTVREAYLGT